MSLLSLNKSDPLSVVMKYNGSFNIPILRLPPPSHPWRKMIPTENLKNSWIFAIDDEEPITARGDQENLVS